MKVNKGFFNNLEKINRNYDSVSIRFSVSANW